MSASLSVLTLLLACSGIFAAQKCTQSELSQLQACSCLKEDSSIALECDGNNMTIIRRDFSKVSSSGEQVSRLQFRNCDLLDLEELPEAYYDTLVTLELSDVTIKYDSVRNLIAKSINLKNLVYDNADISRLDKNFFMNTGNSQLHKVKLMNDKIINIDDDTFASMPLLETIDLNNNLLKVIPRSVFKVKSLKVLDLSGNGIKQVINDETSQLLKLESLSDLKLDNVNCSCELINQDFLKYVKEKKFGNVLCLYPDKLKTRGVSTLEKKDICDGANSLLVSATLITFAIFFYIKNWTN